MTRPESIAAARATCESVLARRDVELVELTVVREGGVQVLRVTLDRPGGALPVDEIASISEEISRALDLDDPIEGAYTLEVSSAGIERPLTQPSDYRRLEGREIRLRCSEAIEGRRHFNGTIRSAGEESFVLVLQGGELVEIPYVAVARANLVVDWEEELRGLRGAQR